MKLISLICAILVSCTAFTQVPCEECTPLDDYYCQLYPEACQECFDTCIEDRRDVRRIPGVSRQFGVDYTLQRGVGAFAIDYGSDDYGVVENMVDDGLRIVNIWTNTVPYCPGHSIEPFPSVEWVVDEPWCEWEQFLRKTRAKQIHVRLHAWADTEGNEQPDACRINTLEPAGFIVYRLYEMLWWKDLTIVVTPWEQGWYSLGCWNCPGLENCCPESGLSEECSWEQKKYEYLVRQDRLIAQYENLMIDVTQARKLMLQRYPNAKLNVLFAMTVNKSGGYNVPGEPPRWWWTEGLPTLAERIGQMKHKPDLVGVSYYVYGVDPAIVLDHIKDLTKFPPKRIFIAEFGGKGSDDQVRRLNDYVPAFWDWGVRTVIAWAWYFPEGATYDKWLLSDEAIDAINQLNFEAITWNR